MNRAILVKSCQPFIARRLACEQTWIRALGTESLVYIVEGGHKLNKIHHLYPADAWRLDLACPDVYQNNSLKLREALRLILLGKETTHVFVVDDDTFVHPKRWLEHEPAGELECRKYRPKHNELEYNAGQPWISGGGGWWMSRRLCELYVAEAKKRTSADDILVARIAARHGIEMIDRPDLYGGDRYSDLNDRVSADNTLITCHHVQPAEMLTLWEATRGL